MIPAACAARFRVEREISTGGYGAVFLAKQLDLDRQVALKVLLPASLADEEQVLRFVREAKLTARLDHPCIVKLYDHGLDDGVPWIAYEYVPGGNLRQRLAAGPFMLADALAMALQVAQGLGAAHAAGLIHRDVKPENVLLAPGGRYKIADFGIVRQQVGRSWETTPGMVLGTPWYIAPETLRERPAPSSDLYGLGIVLWEAIEHVPPCTEQDPVAVLQWHMSPHRPKMRGVPDFISSVIEKMIAMRPEDRYPDVPTLVEALRGALLLLEASAAGTRPPRPAARPVGESAPTVQMRADLDGARRGLYAILAVLTGTLGCLAVMLWWLRMPAPVPPPPPPVRAAPKDAVVQRAASEFERPFEKWREHHDGSYMNPAINLEISRDLEALAKRMYNGLAPLTKRYDDGETLSDYDLMLLIRRSALAWNWACLNQFYRRDAPLVDEKLARPLLTRFRAAVLQARLRALDGPGQFRTYLNDLTQSIYDVAKGMANLRSFPAWADALDLELAQAMAAPQASPQQAARLLDPLMLLAYRTGRANYPTPAQLSAAEAAARTLIAAWGSDPDFRWVKVEKARSP